MDYFENIINRWRLVDGRKIVQPVFLKKYEFFLKVQK